MELCRFNSLVRSDTKIRQIISEAVSDLLSNMLKAGLLISAVISLPV